MTTKTTNLPTPLVTVVATTLALLGVLTWGLAQAQPSQTPLLTNTSGAKPNLMISLDNSGSMAFTFHDKYGIYTDNESVTELKRCAAPYLDPIYWETDGVADPNNNNRCIGTNRYGQYVYVDYAGTSYSPRLYVYGNWSSQRSSDINPIYYNPRTTYLPRVDANGTAIVPTDGVKFVSNQNSTDFDYHVWNNTSGNVITTHSTYASNPSTTGYTDRYSIGYAQRIPQHITYANPTSSSPGFTYSYCSSIQTNMVGRQVGCSNNSWSNVTIKYGSPSTITLPAGHKRTDCTGNTCTNAQEITNILNWYRYYLYRQPAAGTSIGLALANTKLQNKIRVGYISINEDGNKVGKTPGVDTTSTGTLRGVRTLLSNTSNNTTLYNWLYGQVPRGGTPLHNVIDKTAAYYSVGTGALEDPWATNSAALSSATNPEMSCRRSFNLLFSDGAWNGGTSTINGKDYDNNTGTTFTRTVNQVTQTFTYKPQGDTNTKAYTPYPSSGSSGLADLTAQYYWNTDLRATLANGVNTRAGQPTFWQNMATYTVGYLIQPSGEVAGASSGLTFNQITKYQSDFAASGYSAAAKPTWPTGNLDSGSDQNRVDDFIQAGFTGGGAGFSAKTAADVRSIFDVILSDILNSTGQDAGVAVSSSNTSDNSTIAGRLKYGVSYRTLDNSGDIIAQELDKDGNAVTQGTDANGNPIKTYWSAASKIPAHGSRRVFTLSGTQTPQEFTGRFDKLPADVQSALKTGPDSGRIAANSDFVDYLRGKDPVTDTSGVLFRQRTSPIGAMVNPPSIYLGGQRDGAYDLGGTVSGSSSYLSYVNNKQTLPASLFVATNAGEVHALDAAKGDELAAFMPRRSMKRMLNFANSSYSFEYILDGPLSDHDLFDGIQWNQVAVGTGGRGEQLVYALRSPLNTVTKDRTPNKEDYLWETGPDLINDTNLKIGYMTNSARSGQTENGEWVVVLNNGHYNGQSGGSKAGLVVLNALTGAVIKNIPLPATKSAGRGLSGVTLVRNSNKRIVAAYAGDGNGNLWRFNLMGTPSSWKVSYGQPLFTTANNRPIYGAPAWQVHPKGGAMVVVATGMLLEESDLSDTATQEAIYGIWDPTSVGQTEVSTFTTVAQSELLTQGIVSSSAKSVGGNTYYATTNNVIDWTKHRGWTMALGSTYKGERSIDQIRNVGTSVFIPTTVLDTAVTSNVEMCNAANLPANYLYGLRALDGATQSSFDIDGDGKLDPVSMVLISTGGYSRGMAITHLYKSSDQTDAIRKRFSYDESAGESAPTSQKCSDISVKIIGTEEGSIAGGVACPASGWSRSQYQLSRPPSK
jgi:type IV pilus assembly protein PilY1